LQQHVEHTYTYEIAFGAGTDLAVVIPDLDMKTVIREAYRYYRSVEGLHLPLDECIEAYVAGFRAYADWLV
jgi:hypothetical protein